MSATSNLLDGIHFIDPFDAAHLSAEDAAILTALDAPPPYFKRSALTDHLWRAMWYPAHHLSAMGHTNAKSGEPFQCLAYYADDPDVRAFCDAQDRVHVATIGMPFVCQLVRICERIGRVLALRPRSPNTQEQRGAVERDDVLRDLLNGDIEVSDLEAEAIAASWPAAETEGAKIPLGEYALFYDLIRLVWLHEWAHALCGHVRYVFRDLELLRLYEFSAERSSDQTVDSVGAPRNEVLQALEIHADEFATRYCIGEILSGYDPVGRMAGPVVDMVDRLLIFNTACCVFARVWSLAEQKRQPGITFYPPRQDLSSDAPDPMFVPYKTSHPPAVLRYYRFRGFQRDLAYRARQYGDPGVLSSPVDVVSYRFVEKLGQADPRFYELLASTPMVATTPTVKRLEAYEQRLLEVLERISPQLEELGYPPTRDPYADDADESDETRFDDHETQTSEHSAEQAEEEEFTNATNRGKTRELARREPAGTLPDMRISDAEFDNLLNLARGAHANHNLDGARDILHGLIVLDRRSTPAWTLLGQVERAAGLIADAHAALSFALELEPHNATVATELAQVDLILRQGH